MRTVEQVQNIRSSWPASNLLCCGKIVGDCDRDFACGRPLCATPQRRDESDAAHCLDAVAEDSMKYAPATVINDKQGWLVLAASIAGGIRKRCCQDLQLPRRTAEMIEQFIVRMHPALRQAARDRMVFIPDRDGIHRGFRAHGKEIRVNCIAPKHRLECWCSIRAPQLI